MFVKVLLKKITAALVTLCLAQQSIFGALVESSHWQHTQIKDSSQPANTTKPTVLLIEDVHLNFEAQSQTARLLDELTSTRKIDRIGVEGAFESFRFGRFRKLANQETRKKVAQGFLKKNLISAPTYAGISSKVEPTATIGVDDRRLYQMNVQAYLQGHSQQTAIQAQLRKEHIELQAAMMTGLNFPLQEFEKLRSDFHKRRTNLVTYVRGLKKHLPHTAITLDEILSAAELESKLDFEHVSRTRETATRKLIATLPMNERSELIKKLQELQTGQKSPSTIFKWIVEKGRRHHIPLLASKEMAMYATYLSLVESIDGTQITNTLDEAEQAARQRLIKNKDERDLILRHDHLDLIDGLVSFSLTSAQWGNYQKSKTSLSTGLEWIQPESLIPFERFYLAADLRSMAMVNNLLASSTVTPGPLSSVALVAGGFHTARICQILRQRGVSYSVITPKLTKIPSGKGTEYLSIFEREKTPLDHLLSGKQLLINPVQVGGVGTSDGSPSTTAAVMGVTAINGTPDPDSGIRVFMVSPNRADVSIDTIDDVSHPPVNLDIRKHSTSSDSGPNIDQIEGGIVVPIGDQTFTTTVSKLAHNKKLELDWDLAAIGFIFILAIAISLLTGAAPATPNGIQKLITSASNLITPSAIGIFLLAALIFIVLHPLQHLREAQVSHTKWKLIYFTTTWEQTWTILLPVIPWISGISTVAGFRNTHQMISSQWGLGVGFVIMAIGMWILHHFKKVPRSSLIVSTIKINLPIFLIYVVSHIPRIESNFQSILFVLSITSALFIRDQRLEAEDAKIKINPSSIRFLVIGLIILDQLLKLTTPAIKPGLDWFHPGERTQFALIVSLISGITLIAMSYIAWVPAGVLLFISGNLSNTIEIYLLHGAANPFGLFETSFNLADIQIWISVPLISYSIINLMRRWKPWKGNNLKTLLMKTDSLPRLMKLMEAELLPRNDSYRIRISHMIFWAFIFSILTLNIERARNQLTKAHPGLEAQRQVGDSHASQNRNAVEEKILNGIGHVANKVDTGRFTDTDLEEFEKWKPFLIRMPGLPVLARLNLSVSHKDPIGNLPNVRLDGLHIPRLRDPGMESINDFRYLIIACGDVNGTLKFSALTEAEKILAEGSFVLENDFRDRIEKKFGPNSPRVFDFLKKKHEKILQLIQWHKKISDGEKAPSREEITSQIKIWEEEVKPLTEALEPFLTAPDQPAGLKNIFDALELLLAPETNLKPLELIPLNQGLIKSSWHPRFRGPKTIRILPSFFFTGVHTIESQRKSLLASGRSS